MGYRTDLIRRHEEFSLSAWPALHTVYDDGWVLRLAEGYTRRSNSVNPLYASSSDLDAKIERCRQLFQSQGVRLVFKMTTATQPSDLDAQLAQRGFEAEGHTSVQMIDLADLDLNNSQPVTIDSHCSDGWITDFVRLNQLDPARISTISQLLANMGLPAAYATIVDNGEAVAAGLGVAGQGYVALFDIVTDPHQRNRGLGRCMVLNLLRWGRAQGATRGFLQVVPQNTPAIHLYQTIGFREVYQYWYRA